MQHPENIAFNDELNHHLDNEAATQAREERTHQYAKASMERGQEFDPYHPEHLGEALAQMDDSMLFVFACALCSAVDLKLNNTINNHLALVAIQKAVEEYWYEIAYSDAERHVE